jgi:hypothetical protein
MKVEHIVEILDSTPLASLTQEQLTIVKAHCKGCSDCADAYRATMLSSVVLKERVQTIVEPSPFFQTRVLAALREQQAENTHVFARLWKSAGALVSSMAVTTAALAALSFVVPAPATSTPEQTATAYSAESVLLEQASDEQLSYEQVLSAIYTDENEAK